MYPDPLTSLRCKALTHRAVLALRITACADTIASNTVLKADKLHMVAFAPVSSAAERTLDCRRHNDQQARTSMRIVRSSIASWLVMNIFKL